MTTIDRAFLKQFRADLDAAIAAACEKHGITGHAGNASYTATTFTFKCEFAMPGSCKEAEYWKANAAYIGLDPALLGTTFTDRGGRVLTIKGLNSSATKVVLVDASGKQYVAPPSVVTSRVAAKEAA